MTSHALILQAIIDAIEVLTHSPLMGHPVRRDLRELIIGRAAEGYVILYKYIPEIDTAFVLAVRSQREAGCRVTGRLI